VCNSNVITTVFTFEESITIATDTVYVSTYRLPNSSCDMLPVNVSNVISVTKKTVISFIW